MTQTDVAIEHERVGDSRAKAAALGDQCHRAGEKPRRDCRSEERRLTMNVEHAVTVRPADEKAALSGERFEAALADLAFAADLAEAGGEHYRRAHTGIGGRFQ